MIFRDMPIEECEGAILAHAVGVGDRVFKKGRRLSADDVAQMRQSGVHRAMAARLEEGDVGEDDAAAALAAALGAQGIRIDAAFTGRVNLFAMQAGILWVAAEAIDAINAIDEAITIATLPNWAAIEAGQMIATVKIIPFAVGQESLRRCLKEATSHNPVLRVSPYQARQVALIQTLLPTMKASLPEKTREITDRRLAALGCKPAREYRAAHETHALAGAIAEAKRDGAEIILIMGASAITDRRDVIPAAISRSGGEIEQFGMPVDPGNLLLLARIGEVPVLGLPGCARSPKANGFDWVLQRLVAGHAVTSGDVRKMGVGGLLMEIPTRPQPRERALKPKERQRIAAVILAAGRSSRMGENKLLLDDFGSPVILRTVDQAVAAGLTEIVVVVGHDAQAIAAALSGKPVKIVTATDYASGMSHSLRAGLDALSQSIDAAIVMLADMPRVSCALIQRMSAAFRPEEAKTIVVPVHDGKRGNPVLWGRSHFAAMKELAGDVGARHLIGENADQVAEVAVEDAGIFLDVDTPEAYRRLLETPPA